MGPFVNSVACLQKDHKKYPNLFCFVWLVNPEDSEKGLDIFWVWISEIIWADADAGSLFSGKAAYQKRRKFSSSQLALYGWSSLFGKKVTRSGNRRLIRRS